MSRYLLDTSVLIDASKRVEPAYSRILGWDRQGDDLAVCPIQVAEFMAGVSPADRRTNEAFLRAFLYWPIGKLAARRAGFYRYDFARRGIQLHTPDVIIAAVARERGAILVTGNLRDFPMPDVQAIEP